MSTIKQNQLDIPSPKGDKERTAMGHMPTLRWAKLEETHYRGDKDNQEGLVQPGDSTVNRVLPVGYQQ